MEAFRSWDPKQSDIIKLKLFEKGLKEICSDVWKRKYVKKFMIVL